MRLSHNHTDQYSLELRVLELEDTVSLLATIMGTMTEMLGRLNEITGHYADTVLGALPGPPEALLARFPFTPAMTTPTACRDCTCATSGAKAEDTPDT